MPLSFAASRAADYMLSVVPGFRCASPWALLFAPACGLQNRRAINSNYPPHSLNIVRHQVLVGIAPANQLRFAILDHHGGGQGAAVVMKHLGQ